MQEIKINGDKGFKVVGILQVYNELDSGNLERCLKNMKAFCTQIFAYDDGSTDKSVEYMRANGVQVIEGKRNDWLNEIDHKRQLLNVALQSDPTWGCWLDCDEIFQQNKLNDIMPLLKKADTEGYDGIDFHEVNLWRSLAWHRVDSQYGDGWFTRMWRNNGRLRYEPQHGHHLSQVPLGVDRRLQCDDIQVIHYGFSSYDRIVAKYKRYKELGQRGKALKRLIDENGLDLKPVDQSWINETITDYTKPEAIKYNV